MPNVKRNQRCFGRLTPQSIALAEAVLAGATLAEAAQAYGVTTQRAHQIWHRYCRCYLMGYEYAAICNRPKRMEALRRAVRQCREAAKVKSF